MTDSGKTASESVTVSREYDDDGKVVKEITTKVIVTKAPEEDKPWPGQYL